MPVRRYRCIEDLPAPDRAKTAAEGLARACELSEVTRALGPAVAVPRGVRRFRSVEEADADRRERESVLRDGRRPAGRGGPPARTVPGSPGDGLG